jgi:hypothetical protein
VVTAVAALGLAVALAGTGLTRARRRRVEPVVLPAEPAPEVVPEREAA